MTFHDITPWELATASTYIIRADDLENGRNKLGLPVTAPLDTLLCGFCDNPLPANGYCDPCRTIHCDVAGEHLKERWAA